LQSNKHIDIDIIYGILRLIVLSIVGKGTILQYEES